MFLKRSIFSILGVAALAATALVVAVPAEAASSSYINSPTGIAKYRSCPSSTSCDDGFYLTNGSKVTMVCWVDTDNAKGWYWSPRWFKVSVPKNPKDTSHKRDFGYVHSSLVMNQTRVPHC